MSITTPEKWWVYSEKENDLQLIRVRVTGIDQAIHVGFQKATRPQKRLETWPADIVYKGERLLKMGPIEEGTLSERQLKLIRYKIIAPDGDPDFPYKNYVLLCWRIPSLNVDIIAKTLPKYEPYILELINDISIKQNT